MQAMGSSYIDQTGQLDACNAQLSAIEHYIQELKQSEEDRDD